MYHLQFCPFEIPPKSQGPVWCVCVCVQCDKELCDALIGVFLGDLDNSPALGPQASKHKNTLSPQLCCAHLHFSCLWRRCQALAEEMSF